MLGELSAQLCNHFSAAAIAVSGAVAEPQNPQIDIGPRAEIASMSLQDPAINIPNMEPYVVNHEISGYVQTADPNRSWEYTNQAALEHNSFVPNGPMAA